MRNILKCRFSCQAMQKKNICLKFHHFITSRKKNEKENVQENQESIVSMCTRWELHFRLTKFLMHSISYVALVCISCCIKVYVVHFNWIVAISFYNSTSNENEKFIKTYDSLFHTAKYHHLSLNCVILKTFKTRYLFNWLNEFSSIYNVTNSLTEKFSFQYYLKWIETMDEIVHDLRSCIEIACTNRIMFIVSHLRGNWCHSMHSHRYFHHTKKWRKNRLFFPVLHSLMCHVRCRCWNYYYYVLFG